jgi:hypothetical protein
MHAHPFSGCQQATIKTVCAACGKQTGVTRIELTGTPAWTCRKHTNPPTVAVPAALAVGPCEALLSTANLLVVLGLRDALRKLPPKDDAGTDNGSSSSSSTASSNSSSANFFGIMMKSTGPAAQAVWTDDRAVSCGGSPVLTDAVAAASGLKSASQQPPPVLRPHAHQHGPKAITAQQCASVRHLQRHRTSRIGCTGGAAAAGSSCNSSRRSVLHTALFL